MMGLHCWFESAVKVLFHVPDALMKGKQTKYISIISADGVCFFFLRFNFFLQFSALIWEKTVSHQSPLSHLFPQKKSPEPPTFPRGSASLRRDLISKLFRLAHHVSNLPIRSSRRWNAIGTEISDGDHLESREGQLGPSLRVSWWIHSPNLACQF